MSGGGGRLKSLWCESDLGDSCSDKMGQMERAESVRVCFIVPDNVIAAG